MIHWRFSCAVILASAAAAVGLAAAPATAATSGTFTATGTFALSSAELYNPGTNTWTSTGGMTTGRENQTATLLPDGQVLMAGGTLFDHPSVGHPGVLQFLASAELYTP